MRKLYSLTLSRFVALIVWGVVGLVGAEAVAWDPLDDDTPDGVIIRELALPSLPAPRALPRERVELISTESAPHFAWAALHFSASFGLPAEIGKHLLRFLETCRT